MLNDGKDVEELGFLYIADRSAKRMTILLINLAVSKLILKLNTANPMIAILVLGMYLREMSIYVHKEHA